MAIKINGNTVIADNQAFTTTTTISATGNITTAGSFVGNLVSSGPVSTTGNVTGGNVIGGNILTGGVVSATGNITGNFILGNGSQLTGIDATSIQNGTANVRTFVNGNVTTSAAGTANVLVVTSTGTVTTGSVSATGNITGGNIIGTIVGNVSTTSVSASGNIDGGNLRTTGLITATGNITGGNVSATNLSGSLTTAAQANITSVGTLTSLNSGAISSSGNVTGANLLTGGLISATGNVSGGNLNVTGNIVDTGPLSIITGSNGNIALTPNGTGIVTVSSALSVTGTITGGNVSTAGTMSATGNITGGNLLINGSAQITGNLSVLGTETIFNVANLTVNDKDIIVANNVTGGANVDGAGIQAGNPGVATWFYNNATVSWQSNIGITPTANGTLSLGGASNYWGTAFLTTVSVTGNITGGNLLTAGQISTTGTVLANNVQVTSQVSTASFFATGGGTIQGNANFGVNGKNPAATIFSNGNIETAGLISATGAITGTALTGTSLTVTTGNITGGNLLLSGAILDSAQLDIQTTASNANIALAPNGTGVVTVSTQISVVGNVTGGNIRTAGSLSVDGFPFIGNTTNITGGAISAGGNITGGNLSVSTGTVTLGNIVNANGNGVGNIGSSSLYFNTIFAKATSAQYADLAEKYTADAEYAPGTVVVFGGSAEVTVDAVDGDRRVAGVVSTNPSYIMNAGCAGTNVATVALTGRVPCLVTGSVRKGDLMVAAGLGRARAEADPRVGTVIGKALENHDGAEGTIEVVVGRF